MCRLFYEGSTFTVSPSDFGVDHFDDGSGGKSKNIAKHKAPIVAGTIFARNEALDAVADVARAKRGVASVHSLALHRDVSILISKLMQKLQGNIDSSEQSRVRTRHVLKFVLAADLKVSEPERPLDAPQRFAHHDRRGNLKHARCEMGLRLVASPAKEI